MSGLRTASLGLALLSASAWGFSETLSARAAASDVQVTFVPCATDGQLGHEPGPKDTGTAPFVPRSQAQHLAYYASKYLRVLAPRGWTCTGAMGSSGASLLVVPRADSTSRPTSPTTGPAVEVALYFGDTSGRFEAASIAARLFPSMKAYVQRVRAEGLEPASYFASGPYPTDVVTRRSNTNVDFETPSQTTGFGTVHTALAKGSRPIDGFATMIGSENNVVVVAVRMTQEQRDLIPAIVAQAHRESGALAQALR